MLLSCVCVTSAGFPDVVSIPSPEDVSFAFAFGLEGLGDTGGGKEKVDNSVFSSGRGVAGVSIKRIFCDLGEVFNASCNNKIVLLERN